MIDKLSAASDLLCAALDKYLGVCLEIQHAIERNHSLILMDPADRMSHETEMIDSHELAFKKAKMTINRARNRSSTLLINRLPVEILTQVFQLVVRSEIHCANTKHRPYSAITSHPKYPELLSHVCSRWRNIMIACPKFWSHIDFGYWEAERPLLDDRAETYLARAGERPLYVHHVFSMRHFLPPIHRMDLRYPLGPRSYAIEIDLYFIPGSLPINLYDDIVQMCLGNCVPGKLKHLTITVQPTHPSTSTSTYYTLNVIPTQAGIYPSITSLCLKGVYLPWTSPAYHGLVELRLNPAGTISISKPQLIAILTSSPGLQFLEFDIPITTPSESSIEPINIPVRLGDLHTLATGKLALLPLITPGSGAIEIAMMKSLEFPAESKEVREFFARSNVIGLCITHWNGYTELFDLLALAPCTRAVVLEGSNHQAEIGEIPPLKISFHTLAMIRNARIRLEDLQKLVEAFRIQELILCTNHIMYNNQPVHDGFSNVVHDTHAFESLLGICPNVKLIFSGLTRA